MKIIIMLIMSMCLVFLGLSSVHAVGMAKVTIKVIDEVRKPVDGAEVQICFFGGCLKKDVIKGMTGNDGIYSISGFSLDGVVGGTVLKKDYYNSLYHQDFTSSTLGMWQPWDKEITVVLRPKMKPVPMYVRNKWVKIPIVVDSIRKCTT